MLTHPTKASLTNPLLKGAALTEPCLRFEPLFSAAENERFHGLFDQYPRWIHEVQVQFCSNNEVQVHPVPRPLMPLNAQPLSSEEEAALHQGCTLFDEGKFWHAHESWENLWNDLKHRSAPPNEILLIQGLIQTAALLLHHQRKNKNGVVKQWAKLKPKLEGWTAAWGLDIAAHLTVIQSYADDTDGWTLRADHHQLPRA